jgi:hypothetical protein
MEQINGEFHPRVPQRKGSANARKSISILAPLDGERVLFVALGRLIQRDRWPVPTTVSAKKEMKGFQGLGSAVRGYVDDWMDATRWSRRGMGRTGSFVLVHPP